MPRKRCCGLIEDEPLCRRFIPHDMEKAEAVILQIEELEALRLKDVCGLEQTECAAAMGLSRPTFQRLLKSARFKAASALVKGCTIHIEGGVFQMKNRVFECTECHEVWEVEPCSEGGKHGYEIACPKCGSFSKMKLDNGQKHACGGGHGHGGHGHGCCGGHR